MADMKNFEAVLCELEETVKKLEGNVPLDEAIKSFERGIELSKQCVAMLQSEKGKLNLLVDDINKLTEQFNID